MTVDLRTRYLGLELRSPLVASASPLTGEAPIARRLEEAGAAAIVLPSLFEEEILNEEIELNRSLEAGTEQFAEALDYFPDHRVLRRRRRPLPGTPGADQGQGRRPRHRQPQRHDRGRLGPLRAADAGRRRRRARAQPLPRRRRPGRTAADMEAADLELIAAVRAAVRIPLAVKLSPYYSALAEFAGQVVEQGADGLVLFNRFYQPDLDLETLDVVARVELSQPSELRLPLRWIAILRPQLGAAVSLAATSGVHAGTDAVKALMVGADVAMITSALLRHGPDHLRTVEAELCAWMAEHEYESVDQLRGSASQATVEDPSAFERANYMKTLHSWAAPLGLPSGAPS